MKKTILITIAVITVITALILAFTVFFPDNAEISSEAQTESTTALSDFSDNTFFSESEENSTITEAEAPDIHFLTTVDNWLKIYSVEKQNESIALITENISDEDVEFAVLSLEAENMILTFNISCLRSNERVFLLSNENVNYSASEIHPISWKTDDKLIFSDKPGINANDLEINVENGSISVRNISGRSIEATIYLYYKEISNNLLNGSKTGRIRINGLKSDSVSYIKVNGINKDNCKVIFTEYEEKV